MLSTFSPEPEGPPPQSEASKVGQLWGAGNSTNAQAVGFLRIENIITISIAQEGFLKIDGCYLIIILLSFFQNYYHLKYCKNCWVILELKSRVLESNAAKLGTVGQKNCRVKLKMKHSAIQNISKTPDVLIQI